MKFISHNISYSIAHYKIRKLELFIYHFMYCRTTYKTPVEVLLVLLRNVEIYIFTLILLRNDHDLPPLL